MDKWKDYKKKHMKQRGSDSYDKPEEEASRGFFNRDRDEDEEDKKKKKDGLSRLRNLFK